jgi:hypothetical protein
MGRDPFVCYRPGGTIAGLTERIAAVCVVLRNLMQADLILRSSIRWGGWMLLDECVAPHDCNSQRTRGMVAAVEIAFLIKSLLSAQHKTGCDDEH